jgi:type I restriction enzyme S subunit
MKAGWQTKKLREVCELINGRAYSKPELLADGKYRVLRVGNFFTNDHWYYSDLELEEKKYCDTGDLLYAWSASFGPRIWGGGKVIYHYHIWKVVHDRAQIDQKYLFYFFQWDTEKIKEDQGTGTTMMHVSMGSMNDRDIQLPQLPEQHRIVAILDEAFDGIATAKASAEKNFQNARALFESYLQSVFTERGEGWVEKRLSDVCAITSSLVDPRKDEFLDLTHVGAGNIESQTGVFVELKTAREEGLISGKFLFDESMVLYSKIRPYLMKVARPHFNGLCSADMYPLAPLPNEITRDYLFHLLLSKYFTDYAIQGSARAGMPKVNREHLFEFRVWLPAVKKQVELATKLDALHEETQRLEYLYQQKLAALDALKKSLLHQAFSGQL